MITSEPTIATVSHKKAWRVTLTASDGRTYPYAPLKLYRACALAQDLLRGRDVGTVTIEPTTIEIKKRRPRP